VLVLETMVWPDEVRTPDFAFLDDDVTVRPQELAMAESLIESMTADFDPGQYHDEYREALEQVIEAKVEGREVVEQPVQEEDTGSVVDLMAALRASVAAAKKGRGEPDGDAPAEAAPAAKAPAEKAPAAAKKAPAKKAAAKKTAAKKTA
jgi:DNA end-binding protein Ku